MRLCDCAEPPCRNRSDQTHRARATAGGWNLQATLGVRCNSKVLARAKSTESALLAPSRQGVLAVMPAALNSASRVIPRRRSSAIARVRCEEGSAAGMV
jgi:hypothetical protein